MGLGSIPLLVEAVVGTPCDFTVLHGRSSGGHSLWSTAGAPSPAPASGWAALAAQRGGEGAAGVSQHGQCPVLGSQPGWGHSSPWAPCTQRRWKCQAVLCVCLCVDPLGFCEGFFLRFLFFFQSNSTPRGSNWAGGISTVLCVPQGLLLSDLILPPTPFILFC